MSKTARQPYRRKLKESHLAGPVLSWLGAKGLCVHREVRVAAKRVDVVGLPDDSSNSKPWTGVELKLYKWKKALAQAAANAVVFDHNYVALWHKAVAPALSARSEFEQAGIGLLSVSDDAVEVLIEAQLQKPFGQIASKATVRATILGA